MASFTDYSSNRLDEPEFNLREWDRKARITRENPSSRRFSASYIRSFREDARSSGSNNFTISSTASSPGYPLKEEIDPSTYSFSSALKALQAKTVYNNWDWLTPEGFALNSKWNEAEKYICNPLSGEVPMECLSAKTLSGRSFRSTLTSRFTMSAPLFFPNNPNPNSHHPPTLIPQNPKPTCINIKVIHEDRNADPAPVPPPEKKAPGLKRDVGVQSTPADLSSGSPSPAETPPITERFLKRQVEADDSSAEFVLNSKTQEREEVKPKEEEKEKKQETGEKEEDDDDEADEADEEEEEDEKKKEKGKEKRGSNGCWSWMRKRQRHKHKPTKSNNIFPICVPNLKGC